MPVSNKKQEFEQRKRIKLFDDFECMRTDSILPEARIAKRARERSRRERENDREESDESIARRGGEGALFEHVFVQGVSN